MAIGLGVLDVVTDLGALVRRIHVRNLITNNGLDQVLLRPWSDNMLVAVLGTANVATSVSGGATTAAQAGSSLTLAGGAFTLGGGDVGNTIKWTTGGQEARIVSVSDGTHASLDVSQTVSAGAFTLYRTNQSIATMTEVVRSSTYDPSNNGCGSPYAAGVLTHKRTFVFPAEVGSVTYYEVALSHSMTTGAEILSRIALPTPLTVVAGQHVRFTYTLELSLAPVTNRSVTVSITGWPVAPATNTDGVDCLQLLGFKMIDPATGAAATLGPSGLCLEPSSIGFDCTVFLGSDYTVPSAIGNCADRSDGSVFLGPTVAQSTQAGYGIVHKVATYDGPEAESSILRCIGIGPDEPAAAHGYVFVFGQDQTKDTQHTLEIRVIFTWGRTLA